MNQTEIQQLVQYISSGIKAIKDRINCQREDKKCAKKILPEIDNTPKLRLKMSELAKLVKAGLKEGLKEWFINSFPSAFIYGIYKEWSKVNNLSEIPPKRIEFTLQLTLNSQNMTTVVEFLGRLSKLLAELPIEGYFVPIDTDKGSIKITLQGTPEDCEIIINLFNSGELTEINGISITSIQPLTPEREKEIEEKLALIARIREQNLDSHDLIGVNLVGADLSNVNLSGLNFTDSDLTLANLENAILEDTNLTNVDLTGVNLTGANVKRTIFKDNKGLEQATKQDLISRGSIFKDTINFGDIWREAQQNIAQLGEKLKQEGCNFIENVFEPPYRDSQLAFGYGAIERSFFFKGKSSSDQPSIDDLITRLDRTDDENERLVCAKELARRSSPKSEDSPDAKNQGKSKAIATLIELIEQTTDEEIRWEAIECLSLISPENLPSNTIAFSETITLEVIDSPLKLFIGSTKIINDQLSIYLRLYPENPDHILPIGIQLIVIEESGEFLDEVINDDEDNQAITSQVIFESQEKFNIRIVLNAETINTRTYIA